MDTACHRTQHGGHRLPPTGPSTVDTAYHRTQHGGHRLPPTGPSTAVTGTDTRQIRSGAGIHPSPASLGQGVRASVDTRRERTDATRAAGYFGRTRHGTAIIPVRCPAVQTIATPAKSRRAGLGWAGLGCGADGIARCAAAVLRQTDRRGGISWMAGRRAESIDPGVSQPGRREGPTGRRRLGGTDRVARAPVDTSTASPAADNNTVPSCQSITGCLHLAGQASVLVRSGQVRSGQVGSPPPPLGRLQSQSTL